MREFHPGTRLLSASMLLLLLPVFANAAEKAQDQMVADIVSVAVVEQNLKTVRTPDLQEMVSNPEKRAEYVNNLYSSQLLEKTIVDEGMDQDQQLLEALFTARSRVLLDALIVNAFKEIDEDLEALAKERYAADPDQYKMRKKIKVALIMVQKYPGMEDQAKSEIEEIAAKLNADPENDSLFYELAKEHSDDKMADQGGVNKKWLIAPVDLENRSPVQQAAFALDTPGQMTEIIESEYGYSIVRLLNVTPESQLSFAEVKQDIIDQIVGELKNLKQAEVMQSLKAPDDLVFDDELIERLISENLESREAKAPEK
jgi:peptidyl-prolyl cis-trans isomerase C